MASVGLLTLGFSPGRLVEKRRNISRSSRVSARVQRPVAEIEDMDQLGHMVIGVAAVSSSADYVRPTTTWGGVEGAPRPELVDYTIEMSTLPLAFVR
jgi:hypothetical protein